jgi:UDP-2,3-diacylglucosamine pyrophosphatase LpxH
MILIVSDLHLADRSSPATFQPKFFFSQLRAAAREAEKLGSSLQTVLLGDIFEILRSRHWTLENIRPWEDPSSKAHENLVSRIVDEIVKENAEFFDQLNAVRSEHPSHRLHYVIGNHDWPLGSPMGCRAAQRIYDLLLPATGSPDAIPKVFMCPDHGVLATHGHENDEKNRIKRGSIVYGDAIVVEVISQLCENVRVDLNMDFNDSRLTFLRELDNVRPQSPKVWAAWLSLGIEALSEVHPDAYRVVVSHLLEAFSRVRRLTRPKSAVIPTEFLRRIRPPLPVLRWLIEHTLSMPEQPEQHYRLMAASMFDVYAKQMSSLRYIVHGHTHLPEHVPLTPSTGDRPSTVYLNTGTWRRVWRSTLSRMGPLGFVAHQEESWLLISNDREQRHGSPPYALHRIERGMPLH